MGNSTLSKHDENDALDESAGLDKPVRLDYKNLLKFIFIQYDFRRQKNLF
jgi:hypothetical protein